jgi:ankyrin repeat protein
MFRDILQITTVPFNISSHYLFPQTPLHLACQNGHLAIVESLLSSGRSDLINLQDRRGLTGLHLSVETGNYDIVNLLLNRGANANLKNNAGKSALQEAKHNVAILDLINKHLTRNKH